MRCVLVLTLMLAFEAQADEFAEARAMAFDRNKGNCLACHIIAGGEMPGLVAPPLMMMKHRFPDREVLKEQIWDATIRNPESVMPPYGRHGVFTEEELERVVDYIHSL
ncbi:MAG: sulfur oxidation c-type cytochrome SoxX [Gammaproteobacteria bacterium]